MPKKARLKKPIDCDILVMLRTVGKYLYDNANSLQRSSLPRILKLLKVRADVRKFEWNKARKK